MKLYLHFTRSIKILILSCLRVASSTKDGGREDLSGEQGIFTMATSTKDSRGNFRKKKECLMLVVVL